MTLWTSSDSLSSYVSANNAAAGKSLRMSSRWRAGTTAAAPPSLSTNLSFGCAARLNRLSRHPPTKPLASDMQARWAWFRPRSAAWLPMLTALVFEVAHAATAGAAFASRPHRPTARHGRALGGVPRRVNGSYPERGCTASEARHASSAGAQPFVATPPGDCSSGALHCI